MSQVTEQEFLDCYNTVECELANRLVRGLKIQDMETQDLQVSAAYAVGELLQVLQERITIEEPNAPARK